MRTTARRAAAPPRPQGRFGRSGRAPQARARFGGRGRQSQPPARFPRGRVGGRASAPAQKREGEGGGLGRLVRVVQQFLSRSRGRSSRGRGRLPLNAKALAGVLGAGAAGTAMARKRRADRAAPGPEQPPHAPAA
jgi:hypothetical protein